MAKKNATESIDEQAFQALEDALKVDTGKEGGESPDEMSFDDLEAQVSSAARELAEADRANAARTTGTPRTAATSPRHVGAPETVPHSAPARPSGPQPASFAPANDDTRKTPPHLLRAFDARTGHAVRNATILSVLWAIGGIGLALLIYGDRLFQVRSGADLAAMPAAIGIAIGIVVPILLIFAFSAMLSRASELRSAARSMAEVALRLAEPETAASDRIVTVGQAVRREVAAMNEGIERTIARASELETLVHSEVNALERSYADNELRVRNLVEELGSERDAIVAHAERVRASISGAHEQLKDELTIAGDDIAARIATSGEAFASLVETRAAFLTDTTNELSRSIGDALARRTDTVRDTLMESGEVLSSIFDTRLEALTTQLSRRGEALLSEFETRASTLDANTEKLNDALNERARQLNETLIARTREISESLTSGQRSITGGLDEMLSSMGTALDERGARFRQALKTTADEAIMDLDLRSGFFEEKLEATIGSVTSAFDERVAAFASAFDERAGSLD
ncbi:MAG: kinesin, partial [Pararhizobium sp.]